MKRPELREMILNKVAELQEINGSKVLAIMGYSDENSNGDCEYPDFVFQDSSHNHHVNLRIEPRIEMKSKFGGFKYSYEGSLGDSYTLTGYLDVLGATVTDVTKCVLDQFNTLLEKGRVERKNHEEN